jgi:transcriptional regulator with XRE-family HTH domain
MSEISSTKDGAHGIGRRLAAYRTERGIRVSDLARQVGVSPSLVSQIERGQSRPSVSTLFALAEALDVPVDAFFREAPNGDPPEPEVTEGPPATEEEPTEGPRADEGRADEGRYVVRRGHRAAIDIASGVRWERLTPSALRNAEFLELVYGPEAESAPTLYRHPGTEMVLVLSGMLDIYVGFERYRLHPGDSMQLPSALPHRYVNPAKQTMRAVTTILYDDKGH